MVFVLTNGTFKFFYSISTVCGLIDTHTLHSKSKVWTKSSFILVTIGIAVSF